MRLRPALLALATLSGVLVPAAGLSGFQASAGQGEIQASKQAAKAAFADFVNQKDGRYIHIDERNLQLVADLKADGFPTDGFAKRVGHKVTVKRTSSSGTLRVFKVRSIAALSDNCAPTQQSDEP